MGYVGGFGAGRGWLKSSFLLSPEELGELLSLGSILVYTRAAVPRPYRPLPAEDFVDAYRRYLAAAHAGEPTPEDVSRKLHHSLSRTPGVYVERPTRFDPEGHALLDLQEPVVGFEFTGQQLPPGRTGEPPPEAGVPTGLELFFPRVVSFRGGSALESTEGKANRALFDEMVAWAKARTRPIAFVRGDVVKRTTGRVSEAMREWLDTHPTLRAYQTRLK